MKKENCQTWRTAFRYNPVSGIATRQDAKLFAHEFCGKTTTELSVAYARRALIYRPACAAHPVGETMFLWDTGVAADGATGHKCPKYIDGLGCGTK